MKEITQTRRLSLIELSLEDDIDFMAGLLADPEVMHYWLNPLSRAEAVQWIEKQLKRSADDDCGYGWQSTRNQVSRSGRRGC